jgi:hypothetical protein
MSNVAASIGLARNGRYGLYSPGMHTIFGGETASMYIYLAPCSSQALQNLPGYPALPHPSFASSGCEDSTPVLASYEPTALFESIQSQDLVLL